MAVAIQVEAQPKKKLCGIYLVYQLDRPESEPTVLQWRKHTPRTGQWVVGPHRFRETALRSAIRQCLADIAARENRYAD